MSLDAQPLPRRFREIPVEDIDIALPSGRAFACVLRSDRNDAFTEFADGRIEIRFGATGEVVAIRCADMVSRRPRTIKEPEPSPVPAEPKARDGAP